MCSSDLAGALVLVLMAISSPVAGNLIDRYGPRPICPAGLACLSIGVLAVTVSSEAWLGVAPAAGTAPADLAVSVDPSGLAVGDHVIGIQGHPEFDTDFAHDLYTSRFIAIGEAVVDDALTTLRFLVREYPATRFLSKAHTEITRLSGEEVPGTAGGSVVSVDNIRY